MSIRHLGTDFYDTCMGSPRVAVWCWRVRHFERSYYHLAPKRHLPRPRSSLTPTPTTSIQLLPRRYVCLTTSQVPSPTNATPTRWQRIPAVRGPRQVGKGGRQDLPIDGHAVRTRRAGRAEASVWRARLHASGVGGVPDGSCRVSASCTLMAGSASAASLIEMHYAGMSWFAGVSVTRLMRYCVSRMSRATSFYPAQSLPSSLTEYT